VIFVTHDIGVAVEVSDRIGVMYAGKIVELAPVEQMVDAPRHPYSRGLLASTVHDGMRGQRLEAIPGAPPDLAEVPTGCSFAPRCKFVQPTCVARPPDLREMGGSHLVRCVLTDAQEAGVAA
jgi:peptide/nickel transport system ATP-binding protein